MAKLGRLVKRFKAIKVSQDALVWVSMAMAIAAIVVSTAMSMGLAALIGY